MNRKHRERGVCVLATLLAVGIANAQPQVRGTSNEDWRSSLPAFGKAILAVAERSEMVSAEMQMTRLREKRVLSNAQGQDLYVIFKQGFGNEFHGNLSKAFSGPVSWRGVVGSVETNSTDAVHIIKIEFSAPEGGPKAIEFPATLVLRIPAAKLPAAKLPAKGSEFAFRGTLRKDKDEEAVEVWYGLGPHAGIIYPVVHLREVEPE